MSESDTLRRQAANLALIQRYARAWQSGDLPALVACYHPEFTLHYYGHSTLAGQHAGLRTALATLQEFSRRSGRKLVAVLEACAGAERAVLVARERFERQDMRAEVERVFVYSIADERLRQCWVYDADPDLVDRFLA